MDDPLSERFVTVAEFTQLIEAHLAFEQLLAEYDAVFLGMGLAQGSGLALFLFLAYRFFDAALAINTPFVAGLAIALLTVAVPLAFWLGHWHGLGEAERRHRARTRQGRNLGRWS